ncbi:SDR family oxidoreductase [Pseudomonas sp. J452]|uniref:SDR family oxidoreductase n=1 Tax=Pseudomonas sp. J452 TaxID=2898441 RepID=UPI0021ADFDDB|nr:SDR family oxidoreductase [Pseudomonas sp. J452]UUY08665.1 SDR family oxidoreductase [Pseudomonas sp. J452]
MQERKTILITGASSGLGAGMAREFAARGYNLALCARRTEQLESLKAELEFSHGIRVEVRALDVNDHSQVFSVFNDFAMTFGALERVIVNAGIGEGRRIGTGHFETNRRTAETNFIAGLAQCEAAVEIFRRQNVGHLVIMSSMSAKRGLPRHLTTYAASKAAIAHLGEGIRAELLNTPIRVTTLFPGYIRTELNAGAKKLPFEVTEKTGCRALVHTIEREPGTACVPSWPMSPMAILMRLLPLRWVARLS